MRDVRLGRWRGPTISDSIAEALGHEIELAGDSARRTTRRARQLKLVIPIHGEQGDVDPRAIALRMRRQLRAYVNNDEALRDLYLALTYDSEIDAWVVLGNADVEDAADGAAGGAALGEFKATLDLHVDGRVHTHRLGRRLDLEDRRLSSVPRDYYGRLYSTDLAAQTPLSMLWLPVGATDVIGSDGKAVSVYTRATRSGNVVYAPSRADGDALSYEQPAADQTKGDVVIFDRRGFTAPAETLAGAADPQASYGWEEVYGPDQPLTAGDVPVLENGIVRVRWVAATTSIALDQWVAGTGWVERGRVSILRDYPADTMTKLDALVSATVLEWTPEYAALRLVLAGSWSSVRDRVEVIVTLSRGATGPRVEAYGSWGPTAPAGKPGVEVRYSPFSAGAVAQAHSAGGTSSDIDGWPGVGGDYSAIEPWAVVQPLAAAEPAVTLAVIQAAVRRIGSDDSGAYGAVRKARGVRARYGEAAAGYVSVTFGIGQAGQVLEAEAIRNASGTTSQVADGAAAAGQAVEETQVTGAADTLTWGGWTSPAGRYLYMARVRVVNGGATGSMWVWGGGGTTGTVNFTNTAYAWVLIGELLKDGLALGQTLRTWRSGGTGAIRVDKVMAVLLERRVFQEAYDGARDVAQANLYDQRAIPFLVER